MITAPFNFVPLSEEVFFPDWAENISHDIPFEDAQSGVIDITITAKSPIFIRNSSSDRDNPSTEFCNHNGEYYIFGSSVKGMIRNVLEIMSFSKMHENYDDDTYAIRDLRNTELYMNHMKPNMIFCGWLRKKDNDHYILEDCGVPGRIKHEDIDTLLGVEFAKNYKKNKFENKDKNKTAKSKYERLRGKRLDGYTFATQNESGRGSRLFAMPSEDGKTGEIVLTGQPSARNEPEGQKPSGKVYEFVFFQSRGELKVSKEIIKNLRFAYFENQSNESEDWKWRKKQLASGEKIPVFFHKNSDESVKHIGLLYLYKLPYHNSISGGIPKAHKTDKLDFAQILFGHISENNQLKGRVQFSHLKAEKSTVNLLKKRTEILGTPRASYYPIYIMQNGGKYTTYMDKEFRIAGWKRYPVHKDARVKDTKVENEKMATTFEPLSENSIFRGKIRFHNLKKAELGALLSALTFHNTKDSFHTIGMAKPLGYGKIKVDVSFDNSTLYMRAFEACMEEQIKGWADSNQLQELLTMSQEHKDSADSNLEYITMSLQHNEFVKAKQEGDYLYPYSEYDGVKKSNIKTLLNAQDLEEIKNQYRLRQEAKKLQEKQAEEERQREIQLAIEAEEAKKEAETLKKKQEYEAKLEQERLEREAKKAEEAKEQEARVQEEATKEAAKKAELQNQKKALLEAGLSELSLCGELRDGMQIIKKYRSHNQGQLSEDNKRDIELFLKRMAEDGITKKFKKASKELAKWLDEGVYDKILKEQCQ